MMRWNRIVLTAAGAALAGTGCMTGGSLAPPDADQAAVRANLREQWQGFFDKEDRVGNIAWRVAHANAPLCPNIVRRAGFSALDREVYRATMRNRVFRHPLPHDAGKEWAVVQSVAIDSPAWKAGLRSGDVYRDTTGKPKPASRWKAEPTERGDMVLEVRREVDVDTLVIPKPYVCDANIGVLRNSDVNAMTDGRNIALNEGMVDYVESDDELAFIIAHELAHVAQDHIGKRKGNALKGALLGGLVDVVAGCMWCNTADGLARRGAMANSVDFETEADYLGAYFTARAGFDPSAAEGFFARLMETTSTPAVWGTTHPVDAARQLSAALYVEEISGKQRAGEDLFPNKRGES